MSCLTCHTRPVATGYEASGECLGCYWGLTPQSQAAAKRRRKAAKREEDARRTAEGRERGAVYWAWRMCCDAGMGESGRICARLPQPSGGLAWFYPVHRRGYWDLAGFVANDDARARFYTPRWRARLVAQP